MKRIYKKIILAGLLSILFVAISSWDYIYKNIEYSLSEKRPIQDLVQVQIEPNLLVIASLNIQVPIRYVEEQSEEAFQQALQLGVVHYPQTAKPGELGNIYIFGHSSDYLFSKGNYKSIFALLPKMQRGDLITISDDQGQPYNYKVIETKVVSPDDLSVLDQQQNQRRLLTLQTSYPLGTALKRFVVIAQMQEHD